MNSLIHPSSQVSNFILENVVSFESNDKIVDLKSDFNENPKKYVKIKYIYIKDKEEGIIGAIPIQDLNLYNNEDAVTDVMIKNIKHCFPHTTFDHVVIKVLNSPIQEMPVIDHNNNLIGVLSSDILLKSIAEIYEGNVFKYKGLAEKTTVSDRHFIHTIFYFFIQRIPWLVIGLIGGALAARFISYHEHTLEQNIIIALFLPTIVYISDAVATQTETLYIRSLALKDNIKVIPYMIKDFLTALMLGISLGALLGLITFIWKKDISAALVIGISMAINSAIASPLAVLIPTLLKKLHKDPAIGSGPLATIIEDVISIIVYFTIATWLFQMLG